MNNPKLLIFGGIGLGVAFLGLVGYLLIRQTATGGGSGSMTAVVTTITERSGGIEGHYHGIDVSNSSGKYTIDATGYRNIPASATRECLDVPSLTVGQQIQFSLPKTTAEVPNKDKTFDICHKKGVTKFYIKLK